MDGNNDFYDAPDKKQNDEKSWGARALDVMKYVFIHLPAIIPASLATYAVTVLFQELAASAFWNILVILATFSLFIVVFWLALLFLYTRMERVTDDGKRLRYQILFGVYLFAAYAIPAGVFTWEITNANQIITFSVSAVVGLLGYFLFKNRIRG